MKVPGNSFSLRQALMKEQAVSPRNEGHPQGVQAPGNQHDRARQEGLEPYGLVEGGGHGEGERGGGNAGNAILVGCQDLEMIGAGERLV